jgi:hypothetical protein
MRPYLQCFPEKFGRLVDFLSINQNYAKVAVCFRLSENHGYGLLMTG